MEPLHSCSPMSLTQNHRFREAASRSSDMMTPRLLGLACLLATCTAAGRTTPPSMRLPCPLTEPAAVEAILNASGGGSACSCVPATLCKPVAKQHEKEVTRLRHLDATNISHVCVDILCGGCVQVFGFTAGGPSTWTFMDWTQVTTIAWSTEPELVCLAHKHDARLIASGECKRDLLTQRYSLRDCLRSPQRPSPRPRSR